MRMIFEESETRVFIENNITESFNINVAMRQFDALLVILFNLVLDYIMKKLIIRGNISTKMRRFGHKILESRAL
jgi:hypothetical protein